MTERLGNQASNQKVAGSIQPVTNDVVSLGKPLHPTCLGESLWIRASAKLNEKNNSAVGSYWCG